MDSTRLLPLAIVAAFAIATYVVLWRYARKWFWVWLGLGVFNTVVYLALLAPDG